MYGMTPVRSTRPLHKVQPKASVGSAGTNAVMTEVFTTVALPNLLDASKPA